MMQAILESLPRSTVFRVSVSSLILMAAAADAEALAALALADAADVEVLAEADALAALDPELPAQPASKPNVVKSDVMDFIDFDDDDALADAEEQPAWMRRR